MFYKHFLLINVLKWHIAVDGLFENANQIEWTYLTVTKLITDGPPCKDGWIPHKNSCYMFVKKDATYEGALKACADLGSHLVSISGPEENDFLKAK